MTICWNALDRPRALGTDSETHITRLLFRDGVIYFIVRRSFDKSSVRKNLTFINTPLATVDSFWCAHLLSFQTTILNFSHGPVLRVANTVLALVAHVSLIFVAV